MGNGKEDRSSELERVQRIWEHPVFQESLLANERMEEGRIFCGHGWGHLLDVARIAHIENLESGAGVSKSLIYASALLHDIGRYQQYASGMPHHEAGARLAAEILPECGFSREETDQILEAILRHRDPGVKEEEGLPGLLYRADKLSRCCFSCRAEAECNWSSEKKNMHLKV